MKLHPIPAFLVMLCLAFSAPHDVLAEEQTIEQITAAADKGDAEAQYRLGQALIRGVGVRKDTRRAYEYLQKAAEQGHADAIGGIGFFHASGLIVKKDPEAAAKWFRKGADKGGPRSQINYGLALLSGRGVTKDEAEGTRWIDKALVQGLPLAYSLKGDYHLHGLHGHPKDYQKAREYLEKAALADIPSAQNNLGVIYQEAYGVKEDPELAKKWYRKAAEQGYPKAMSNLGRLLGPVSPDKSKHVEALMWLKLASDAGEVTAQVLLNEIGERPIEVTREAEKRMGEFVPRPSQQHEIRAK